MSQNETKLPMRFPHLFSGVRLGSAQAKNRIMRVATTSNLAEQNRVGERMLSFYRTVAEGGAGVIVSEATRVHPSDGVVPSAIPLFDRGVIPGLTRIADACHENGALFIAQLNHGGRQHLGRRSGTLIAPSAIACTRSGGIPHALSTEEVEDMVECFLNAAVIARDSGADGVEIHGAQGHLIGQFSSPYSNHRDDKYGGNFDKRLRFAREILEGVRKRLDAKAVVGYRLGVEEFTDGGLGIDDTIRIAQALKADGLIDYLSLSQGNFNSIETHLPDRHWPPMVYRALQSRIKKAVGDLIVVQSTRIIGPEDAEDIIASRDGDMVGLCRALIVDPAWPNKAKDGREAEIRRCIACNQCWDWISSGEPIACATNPVAGGEYLFGNLEPAGTKKKIVIAGGGPAGLETARVAAERGHHVVLMEMTRSLGGKIIGAAALPNNAELENLPAYLTDAVTRLGIDIRLGTEATRENILSENPDAVVIATGAEPVAPDLPGDNSVAVMAAIRPEDIAAIPANGDALILMDEDGYYWGSAIAEAAAGLAASRGQTFILCTRFFEPFRELPMVSRIASLRTLGNAIIRPLTAIKAAEKGAVLLEHTLTGQADKVEKVAGLIWVGRQKTRATLYNALRGAGLDQVFLIGDAYAPRRAHMALVEAHTLARKL